MTLLGEWLGEGGAWYKGGGGNTFMLLFQEEDDEEDEPPSPSRMGFFFCFRIGEDHCGDVGMALGFIAALDPPS